MASIVTKILSSTVGLLVNKARDSTAAKLKDGDVADARIRELVVRELNDVKTKLDGLSRANLLSSYNFVQEGVNLLILSINKSTLEQKALPLVNETQDDQGETAMPTGAQSEILDEALVLSHAMKEVKINSDRDFESAKKRFEEARTRATDVFFNEALSAKDRILAAKIRIVSEILEYLESPETAIAGCLPFLKKLHSLPAIQETFSVYLNGGMKSLLNKSERVENVRSVMLINYVLFQYVSKFSSIKYSAVLAWPTIKLDDRSFNPILDWQDISTRKSMAMSMGEELPNELILEEEINPYCSAVNSHGDVIVGVDTGSIKIMNKTGESKVVKLPEPSKGSVINQRIKALAVDKDNNVYVVRCLATRTENGDVTRSKYVLTVLDDKYNEKQDPRTLEFLPEASDYYVKIAINKNNNIIMTKFDDFPVYICDNTGKLKHKFERGLRFIRNFGISGQDEIMIASHDSQAVEIYSEEGNLKSTIKLPEGHTIQGLAFHYVICKIIVLTHGYVREKNSCFLLCYAEAGELESTTFLCKRNFAESLPNITSHPSGPVAVVMEKRITFI